MAKSKGKRGKEIMVVKSFSLPGSLWEQAIKKAERNAQSLSAVIRILIEKWLRGEVTLEETPQEQEKN